MHFLWLFSLCSLFLLPPFLLLESGVPGSFLRTQQILKLLLSGGCVQLLHLGVNRLLHFLFCPIGLRGRLSTCSNIDHLIMACRVSRLNKTSGPKLGCLWILS